MELQIMEQQFLQRWLVAASAVLGFTALTSGSAQAASFTFDQSKLTLNGGSTPVNFNITMDDESAGAGKVQLKFDVADGFFADLRGLFLHIQDESLLSGLQITGDNITKVIKQANSVSDLGQGNNINGSGGDFDIGIDVGTPGEKKDDVRSAIFTFSHSSRALSLADFGEQNFGIRMTSVGTTAKNRGGSSKLVGDTPIMPPVVVNPPETPDEPPVDEPPVDEPPIDNPDEPVVPPVVVDPTPPKEEKPVEVPEPSMVLLSLASLGALKLVKRRQPEASIG
ncbi:MAG: PEP-CTERM sorting domain-containing protein [Elainella sp. Prado103]|nr:PEP-CTERM sorting domain-containing protein [Elainella sp. Prado103]